VKNKREYILDGKNMLDCEYVKGQRYIGEHKNGIKDGHGTYYYATGAKYVGEWKNDLKHGQGTLTFGEMEFEGSLMTTGGKYVGEWKDGRQCGEGTWTDSDGTKHVGEWKNGKMWSGTTYDVDGNVKATCFERNWNVNENKRNLL